MCGGAFNLRKAKAAGGTSRKAKAAAARKAKDRDEALRADLDRFFGQSGGKEQPNAR